MDFLNHKSKRQNFFTNKMAPYKINSVFLYGILKIINYVELAQYLNVSNS